MNLSDLASTAGTFWSEVALVLSLMTFVGVACYVFLVRRTPSFEHQRHLPLDDTAPLTGALSGAAGEGDES